MSSGTLADERALAISALGRSEQRGCSPDDDMPSAHGPGTIVPFELFPVLLRTLWPTKAEHALHDYAGVPESTGRSYRRGIREPSMSVLWLLLRSREGYRVLSFIMDHDPPAWWLNVQSELRLAILARDIFKQLEPVMRDG